MFHVHREGERESMRFTLVHGRSESLMACYSNTLAQQVRRRLEVASRSSLLTPEIALRLSKKLSDAAFDLMINHAGEDVRESESE